MCRLVPSVPGLPERTCKRRVSRVGAFRPVNDLILVGGQVRVLAVRTVRFYIRNPELVLAKLFTYIFMGCFMGAPAACCCGHLRTALGGAQLQRATQPVCAASGEPCHMREPLSQGRL